MEKRSLARMKKHDDREIEEEQEMRERIVNADKGILGPNELAESIEPGILTEASVSLNPAMQKSQNLDLALVSENQSPSPREGGAGTKTSGGGIDPRDESNMTEEQKKVAREKAARPKNYVDAEYNCYLQDDTNADAALF